MKRVDELLEIVRAWDRETVNDGFVRLAMEEGLEAPQALFLRGGGMIVILGVATHRTGQRLQRHARARLGARCPVHQPLVAG